MKEYETEDCQGEGLKHVNEIVYHHKKKVDWTYGDNFLLDKNNEHRNDEIRNREKSLKATIDF